MATEKEIASPAQALKQAAEAAKSGEADLVKVLDAQTSAATPPPVPPIAPAPAPAAPAWKFVKNFSPLDVIKFKDGTEFQFRLISLNDGTGYASNSFVTTGDETLAKNLREAASNKALGLVEVKI